MAKRIKIALPVSNLNEIMECHIFRGDTPSINFSNPTIKVSESYCFKKSIREEKEVLVQSEEKPLDFYVSKAFLLIPDPEVYVDDELIDNNLIAFNQEERKISLTEVQVEPETDKVIKMSYSYLAMYIEDDINIIQNGVYFQSLESVTGIKKPSSYTCNYNFLSKELNINFVPDFSGVTKYYAMQYVNTRNNTKSDISTVHSIDLIPNQSDIRYKLEYSQDNGLSWVNYGESQNLYFNITDYQVISIEPHPELNYEHRFLDGDVELQIENPWYNWNIGKRQTNKFRISSIDTRNKQSDYLTLEKSLINYRPQEVIIRRKLDNGTPASYEGFDAITLAIYEEADLENEEKIVFNDFLLSSGKIYSYTIYVKDEYGIVSLPTVIQVAT